MYVDFTEFSLKTVIVKVSNFQTVLLLFRFNVKYYVVDFKTQNATKGHGGFNVISKELTEVGGQHQFSYVKRPGIKAPSLPDEILQNVRAKGSKFTGRNPLKLPRKRLQVYRTKSSETSRQKASSLPDEILQNVRAKGSKFTGRKAFLTYPTDFDPLFGLHLVRQFTGKVLPKS